MADLSDGETTRVKGSGANEYTLKNSGGVYSCTCPAWMHQSTAIERRSCKHLRAFRGDEAEKARVGDALPGKPVRKSAAAVAPDDGGEEAPLAVLLAEKWELDRELTGWWMSEKLDGVRAYWDGAGFRSRAGNAFFAPTWFTAGLPKDHLDGELFGGRKNFQRTVGVVKRQDRSDAWKELKYVVFDAPNVPGTFEERLAKCAELLPEGMEWAEVHPHEPCRDVEHLRTRLAEVEALGGEGLMLRQPGSLYVRARSSTLLKVKSFHDAEARVVAHEPGAGRHKGRLGALQVELPDGTRFKVGTGFSDAERAAPPPIGAIITFRYQELTDGGVPRFPSYVGVRVDLTWNMVGGSTKVHAAPQKAAPSKPAPPPASKPPTPGAGTKRYFELLEGNSSKFWELTLRGQSFTTRYGKIGSGGQTTLKEFASDEDARREADSLISQKTRKGYTEK